MKKTRRMIKLTQLNSEHLSEKELNHARGGECSCSCFYAACGGSSNYWNDNFNTGMGFVSPLPPVNVDCGIVP